MKTPTAATPAQIRAQLDHPVIDVDGHVLEFMPAALPYLREALGSKAFERYRATRSALARAMSSPSAASRLATRQPQTAWWGSPANARDVATSIFPRLLHERLPELGIDYMILYPTNALGSAGIADDELRRGLCRGFNAFFAESYRPFSDRLTVSGMIPMNTPEEAIDELEHCRALDLKVVGIPHGVMRKIERPQLDQPSPWLWPGQTSWFDHFGHESAHDYDPVWRRFQELGFAVTAHGGIGNPPPNWYSSTSSWMYNHIGSFAAMMYPLCKSLYIGGVAKRFPELPMAFLECGIGWACTLLADTKEHYEKRNPVSLAERYAPELLDRDELVRLAREYGSGLIEHAEAELEETLMSHLLTGVPPENHDEFPSFESLDDLREPFERNFYFGCEADDRTVAFAFSKANAFGTRLKPMFSSDISHFDVPEMLDVLPNAFGMLEKQLLAADEFREFSFENAARLHLCANRRFFVGTAIESEAARLLSEQRPSGADWAPSKRRLAATST